MEFLVFWLGCSVAIGILASNRGRSGFGWFLFSIFLSPLLGLIFVLVTRNLKVEQQLDALNLEKLKAEKATDSEEQTRCPDCRELIRFDARKCKHCGSIISESTPA
jgi:uncharacterized paraquat-inducible protein A